MPIYCKAYKLDDVTKFSGWSDAVSQAGSELGEDAIVYILESLVVTTNPLDFDSKDDYIFEDISEAWKNFLTEELKFKVPDWEEVPSTEG